jgi:hypothetical protein
MNYLTPRRIGEMDSDSRGIKEGWYAANKTGKICSRRFSDQEACQAHITQERTDIDEYARERFPKFSHSDEEARLISYAFGLYGRWTASIAY